MDGVPALLCLPPAAGAISQEVSGDGEAGLPAEENLRQPGECFVSLMDNQVSCIH